VSLRVGASPSSVGIDGSSRRPGGPVTPNGKPSFATILRDAVNAADRGRTPSLPVRADASDTARSLALQAEVYRESERVEIVSRLVDHAVSAVKTLLQSRF
jgi:hypothetical protein